LAIGGEDPTGLYLATFFPGGSLVSSSNAHRSFDPREVIQCLPDPAPGRFLARHQEALDALAALGVEPEPLPEDLLGRVEEEWHAETGAILDVGVLRQLLATGRFWQAPRATVPVADRANLDKIAAHLRGVG
jgi:hypothetical protein